jgi:hypothetical protein
MYHVKNKVTGHIIEISYSIRLDIDNQYYIDVLDFYKNEDYIILYY